jgi:hypothetical protein
MRKRSLSAKSVIRIKHRTLSLGGEWGNCVGEIDRTGVVFFWGGSGNGKTSAVVSFAKELSTHGRVLYVSLEEGYTFSFQNTLRRFDMQECNSNFMVLAETTIDELSSRLLLPRSPEFVVIDSFQYLQMTYRQYIAFKERHRDKMLIFVSHADGKQPAGRAAKSVMFDAGLKIWVEGHMAFSKGRFIGPTGKAVIWEQGAEQYWGIATNEIEEYEDTERSQKMAASAILV